MKLIIALLLGGFIAVSTYYNVSYGLGISVLAGVTYAMYGFSEVVLSLLAGYADRQGKAVALPVIALLLSVSLFTAVALKTSEAHEMEARAKNVEGTAQRAIQGEEMARQNLAIAQEAYQSAKAEYDSFPAGSAAANRRKAEVKQALQAMQSAQTAYISAGGTATAAQNNVQSNEAAIYRQLSDWLGGSPEKWATAFFLLNALIIVFGFSAIFFVWHHQRPGTPYCITVSAQAERAIAEARQYELEVRNEAKAAKIRAKAEQTLSKYPALKRAHEAPVAALAPPQQAAQIPHAHASNDDTPQASASGGLKLVSNKRILIPTHKNNSGGLVADGLTVNGTRIDGGVVDSGCATLSLGAKDQRRVDTSFATEEILAITANGNIPVRKGVTTVQLHNAPPVTIEVTLNPGDHTLIGLNLLEALHYQLGGEGLTIGDLAAHECESKAAGGRPKLSQKELAFSLIEKGEIRPTQTSLTSSKAKSLGLAVGRERAKKIVSQWQDVKRWSQRLPESETETEKSIQLERKKMDTQLEVIERLFPKLHRYIWAQPESLTKEEAEKWKVGNLSGLFSWEKTGYPHEFWSALDTAIHPLSPDNVNEHNVKNVVKKFPDTARFFKESKREI